MSVYDPIELGPAKLVPDTINGDAVMVELVGDEGIYAQDGALYVPVRFWEAMQAAAKTSAPIARPPLPVSDPLEDPDEEPAGFDGLVLPMDDDKVPAR
jgi:hypothetical protein